MNCFRLSFFFFALFQAASFAVDESFFGTGEAVAAAGPAPIISFGYIVQLLFSLLVVAGFIYVAAKYVLPKVKVGSKGNYIDVIDRAILEPQVTAYIIKVHGSSWLVVVSNKSVARIDRIEEDIEGAR